MKTHKIEDLKANSSLLTVLKTGLDIVVNRGFTQHYVIRKSTMKHNKLVAESMYGTHQVKYQRFPMTKKGLQGAIDQINEWRDERSKVR